MTPDELPTAYDARMAARYDEDFVAAFGGQDRGDLTFFEAVASACDGPMCEIGAGTGRVSLAIARAATSRRVTAVEPSAAMREAFVAKLEAEPALAERVTLVAGSFGALPLPDASMQLVFAAFRSFQHVLTVAEQLAALAEMRRVLVPGGRLALDFFDPTFALLCDAGPALGLRYRSSRGTRVERWESRRVRRVEQVIEVTFRWLEKKGSQVIGEDVGVYDIRYTFAAELGHLLARAGFEAIDMRGDYAGHPLGKVAREIVVIAEKPAA